MLFAACSVIGVMRGQHLMTSIRSTQVAFIIGQSFLSTLCVMRWGTFVFYAAFLAVGVVFAILFIPETKVSRTTLLVYTLDTVMCNSVPLWLSPWFLCSSLSQKPVWAKNGQVPCANRTTSCHENTATFARMP